MNYIKIGLLFLFSVTGGCILPNLAQRLIEDKCRRKKKEVPRQSGYWSPLCKIMCGAVPAASLGACVYFRPSGLVFFLLGLMNLIGMLIFLVDLRCRLITNETVILLLMVGLAFRVLTAGVISLPNSLFTMILILISWIIFGRLMGPEKVGGGDIKLCVVLGMIFGYPAIIVPLFTMSVLLMIFCFWGLVTGRLTGKSRFPLGPFLVIGMLVGLPYYLYMVL